MNTTIENYFKSLRNKRVMFIGIGRSNIPAMEIFCKYGARVIASDKKQEKDFADIIEHLKAIGVSLQLGEDYLKDTDVDLVFRTPGMPFFSKDINNIREKNIPVTSEMELFFDLCPCKIIAVTGSDGKTTTTTIISKMLEQEGKKVFLGGNIGKPLLPQLFEMKQEDYAVVELSSFQLISMRKSPDIAVVTNLSPNHLDIHANMQEYINAKKNIILHQGAASKTVLNYDNAIAKSFEKDVRGKKYYFSKIAKPRFGTFLKDNAIYLSEDNEVQKLFNTSDIKIPGQHNVENYMAACTALSLEVSKESMRQVALDFGGVEHRLEFVREFKGVKYYNDAIATSPTRAIKGALSINDEKIILIAGGYDKNIPFDTLGEVIPKRVKLLILMGNTAQKIKQAVKNSTSYDEKMLKIIKVKTMNEAVSKAAKFANVGDKVYMSPACASFDMYKDFEAKGNDFKKIVNSL